MVRRESRLTVNIVIDGCAIVFALEVASSGSFAAHVGSGDTARVICAGLRTSLIARCDEILKVTSIEILLAS